MSSMTWPIDASARGSSAILCRSRSTATRSESRSTSSSSAEMNSTAMPSPREVGDELLDLGLGADVDAAGGLVEDQQPRLGDQPAGQQHLLLVAAGEVADERPGSAGRMSSAAIHFATSSSAVRRGSRAPSRGGPAARARCCRAR